ncbi:MAG: S9 family peptidase [Pseudomonadota bacterium]
MTRFWLMPAGALLAMVLAAPALSGEEAARVSQIGGLRMEGVPDLPPALIAKLRRYSALRETRFLDWQPGGKGMLVAANEGETTQLFLIEEPGAKPRQLTDFDQPVTRGMFAADGGVVFARDRDGDENFHFYRIAGAGGEVRALTQPGGRNSNAVIANDRRRIAYTRAQTGEGDDWGVLISAVEEPGATRVLFQDPGAWLALDWSPNDKWLLLLRFTSVHDSTLYIADVATGIKAPLDAHAGAIGYSDARFAPDGRGVYYTSNAQSDFLHLRYRGFDGALLRTLTADIPWNVTQFDISPDGRAIAFAVNEGGAFRLVVRDLASGATLWAPDLPMGLISDLAFDEAGKRLGFSLDAARLGQNAYALDMATGAVTQWSRSDKGIVAERALPEPEMITYPSFDLDQGAARRIPALIYRPVGPGPHPVVIRFHGGPEAQSVASYSATTQFWVRELGVAVILPNVRGSTGYGRDFAALDNGRLREDAVRDVGALLDWIAAVPDLDASRVMVQGASYGGYLTLASLVRYNDRLRGGIDIVGISNFVTFLQSTGEFRRDLRRVEYGDENDPQMRAYLNAISPLTNARRITRPLLVAQGRNDPRVPASESEQMVRTLRAQGGEVWYLLAEDEGHGFSRRGNAEALEAASALFIARTVLGGDKLAALMAAGERN